MQRRDAKQPASESLLAELRALPEDQLDGYGSAKWRIERFEGRWSLLDDFDFLECNSRDESISAYVLAVSEESLRGLGD